eukprot:TRINITY_DN225_c0_g1_i3.p1 TRINITY_DN225_c0_g1~~TRINITY_DN225_c0_g1_i3.p1  ORF type:complete len:337 (+),score=118.74 TRINITY_DN225_c0_g1_i3:60-1013(+)
MAAAASGVEPEGVARARALMTLRAELGETHYCDLRGRLLATFAATHPLTRFAVDGMATDPPATGDDEDAADAPPAAAAAPKDEAGEGLRAALVAVEFIGARADAGRPAAPTSAPAAGTAAVSSLTSFVGTSTLVVMPPPDLWSQIVEIKKNHMNPRIKRPPYPHVTLMAPFVGYAARDAAGAALTAALADFPPFSVRIDTIKMFYNKSSYTMYLDPETDTAGVMDKLFATVSAVFPAWQSHGFDAHIGIGFFRDKSEAEKLLARYQSQWKPIKFLVKEIYMNTRVSEESPWEVRKVIPLGTKLAPPTTPHFVEKPEA